MHSPETPVLANAIEGLLGPWTPGRHAVEGLHALRPTDRVRGPVHTMRFSRASERSPANALAVLAAYDAVPAGAVAMIEVRDDVGGAVMGDIIAHRLRRIGVAAVVVDGPVRDLDGLAAFGPPVWYRNHLVTGLEMAETRVETGLPVMIAGIEARPGQIAFADRDGIILLPDDLCDGALARSETVAGRERRWHEKIEAGEDLVSALGHDGQG